MTHSRSAPMVRSRVDEAPTGADQAPVIVAPVSAEPAIVDLEIVDLMGAEPALGDRVVRILILGVQMDRRMVPDREVMGQTVRVTTDLITMDRRWLVVDRVAIVATQARMVRAVPEPAGQARGIRSPDGSRIWNASSRECCTRSISCENKWTTAKVADLSDPIRLDMVPAPVRKDRVARR